MSEWRTNRTTGSKFRRHTRPFAKEDQLQCVCMGECLGNERVSCPFRGNKRLGGYCAPCYAAVRSFRDRVKAEINASIARWKGRAEMALSPEERARFIGHADVLEWVIDTPDGNPKSRQEVQASRSRWLDRARRREEELIAAGQNVNTDEEHARHIARADVLQWVLDKYNEAEGQ